MSDRASSAEPGATEGFVPVDPAYDDQAAALLEEWARFHHYADGAAFLAELREDEQVELHGVTLDRELVVVIATRRAHLMNELLALTVLPSFRGHGIGELALVDTVRRADRRPLVVECPESMRPWFLKRGFKIVGRRIGAEGEPRYRLGAHAPRQQAVTEGGSRQ